jgi:hypothetical protein
MKELKEKELEEEFIIQLLIVVPVLIFLFGILQLKDVFVDQERLRLR